MYKSYLVMKVTEVKEVMAFAVSPVQCTHYVYFCGLCLLYWLVYKPTNEPAGWSYCATLCFEQPNIRLLDPKMGLKG